MDNKKIIKNIIETNERLKFSQDPYEYLFKNNLLEYNFLIKDSLKETKLSVLKYVYGEKYCKFCKKPVNKLLHGWKGLSNFCDRNCSLNYMSESRKGQKNPVHRMTNETKENMKKKLSVIMKNKILSGEFTPKSENYKCFGMIEFYLDNNVKKVRSFWELFFWLMNPYLEYEKVRLKYQNNHNENKIYITDFYDKKLNIIYEVKPKKYQYQLVEKKKSVIKNGYLYQIIDEDYFKQFDTIFIKNKIENSLLNPEKYLTRLKGIKRWKK